MKKIPPDPIIAELKEAARGLRKNPELQALLRAAAAKIAEQRKAIEGLVRQ